MNQMQVLTTDTPDLDVNDLVMSRHMADTLHRAYPGHLWAVTCDGWKGIATVRNLRLSGTWGFVLKLPAIYSASEWDRRVLMAGGEILERFGIPRLSADRVADVIDAAPMDFAGRLTMELD